MMRSNSKVMGLAVASGKVGMVILRNGQPLDWKISKKASRSPTKMQKVLQGWLELHGPDLVITEEINPYSRKSDKTLSIMSAAEGVIHSANITHHAIARERNYPNKYDEIAALSEQFPNISPWAPDRRKFYDPEPVNTILFEALSLVLQTMRS